MVSRSNDLNSNNMPMLMEMSLHVIVVYMSYRLLCIPFSNFEILNSAVIKSTSTTTIIMMMTWMILVVCCWDPLNVQDPEFVMHCELKPYSIEQMHSLSWNQLILAHILQLPSIQIHNDGNDDNDSHDEIGTLILFLMVVVALLLLEIIVMTACRVLVVN